MNTYILECAQTNSDPAYLPTGEWMRANNEQYETRSDALSAVEELIGENDTAFEYRVRAVFEELRISDVQAASIGGELITVFNAHRYDSGAYIFAGQFTAAPGEDLQAAARRAIAEA